MKKLTKFCGDLLEIRRKNSKPKISQQLIADKLGVSKMAVNYWEKGTYKPKQKYITKIAKLFNERPERFLVKSA